MHVQVQKATLPRVASRVAAIVAESARPLGTGPARPPEPLLPQYHGLLPLPERGEPPLRQGQVQLLQALPLLHRLPLGLREAEVADVRALRKALDRAVPIEREGP